MFSDRDNKGFDLINHAIRMGGGVVGFQNAEQQRNLDVGGRTASISSDLSSGALSSLQTLTARPSQKGLPLMEHRKSINTFQFPWKLHSMLDSAAEEGFEEIVSWEDDGRSFRVHNTQKFVERVMGRWFKQSKYKSFQRQLNLYGFSRLNHGRSKGGYMHPHFVRGQRKMCQLVTRGAGMEGELGGSESSKDLTTPNHAILNSHHENCKSLHHAQHIAITLLADTAISSSRQESIQSSVVQATVITTNSGDSSGMESGSSHDGESAAHSSGKDNRYEVPFHKEIHFPLKLYEMLDRSEVESFEHIVSWEAGNFGFRVHDPALFSRIVLPQFFHQSNYKSFQRQLNLYGFRRIDPAGTNGDAFRNEFFIKGKKELVENMSTHLLTHTEEENISEETKTLSKTTEISSASNLFWGQKSGIPAIIAAIECSEVTFSEKESTLKIDRTSLKDLRWCKDAHTNFGDWTIEVMETESGRTTAYYVHLRVLALSPWRSDYFARLFKNPEKTSKSILKLHSAEVEVFPMVLEHMYTGSTLEMDPEKAYALYNVADQLEIPTILHSATEFFKSSMTKENIISFISVGLSLRHKMLLDAALTRCAEELGSLDQLFASKIPPVVFLELLRRNNALNKNIHDASSLSLLVAACMEGQISRLTVDIFESLLDKAYLPCINSGAAIRILALEQQLNSQGSGKANTTNHSLHERCVVAITKDWHALREKLTGDSILATRMKTLPSSLMFEILMATPHSCC